MPTQVQTPPTSTHPTFPPAGMASSQERPPPAPPPPGPTSEPGVGAAALPSFAEFVVQSWGCLKDEDGEAYDKALTLAETNLFGRLGSQEVAEVAEGGATPDCIPTQVQPTLAACQSCASSVKDDEDPARPKAPLIGRLDDLAAAYFGHFWDRVDEMVQVNQDRLEAWKARRQEKGGCDPGCPAMRGPSVAPSASSVGDTTSIGSHKLHDTAVGDGAAASTASSGPGRVVEVGEDAIDLLLGGLPGAAVEHGRKASIPGLTQAEIILLEVQSDHCPACTRLAPTLQQVAQHFKDRPEVLLVCVNGPANPAFLERLDVQFFPTLKCLDRRSQTMWDWPPLPAGGPSAADVIALLETYLARSALPALGVVGTPLQQSIVVESGNGNKTATATAETKDGKRAASLSSSSSSGSEEEEEDASASATATDAFAAPEPSQLPTKKKQKQKHLLLEQLAEVPPDDQPPSFEELSQLKNELVCTRDLASRRKWVSAMEIFRALGCHDETSCRALTRSHDKATDEPPHLILLGGGMGSGKTTLKKMVTQTEFWRRHGQNVVSVEADHFKSVDPVYQLLTRANLPKASEHVHHYSTQAAEELFLSALKFRRDVVFDSTLAWAPFLQQTLDMVRDAQHSYKRGPGYVQQQQQQQETASPGGQDSAANLGAKEEKYWEVDAELPPDQQAVPYRVELVGVYVRPEVAVRRAIIRRLLTGRGVPVRDQLRSHALFAKNFASFALCFDTVVLYDNNRRREELAGDASAAAPSPVLVGPRVIARKDLDDTELQILDAEAFRAFQDVAKINVDATCVEELYPDKAGVGGEHVHESTT